MRLIFTGLSLIVLLVACGGGESADGAVSDLVEAFSDSDYETAYDMLHPKHQAIVSEQLFSDCGQQAEAINSARVDEFDIAGDTQRDRTVPELGEVKVTEVGVNLTQGDRSYYRTWDVIKDDGEWRWLVADDDLNDFRAGRCPGQAASAQP